MYSELGIWSSFWLLFSPLDGGEIRTGKRISGTKWRVFCWVWKKGMVELIAWLVDFAKRENEHEKGKVRLVET